MTDWTPQYRYWVAEKGANGWVCFYKTNWGWDARRVARKKSRQGFQVMVEKK